MIVVADTTPLNYLILISSIEVLEPLFGSVIVPSAVRSEMLRSLAPAPVRAWANSPPHWIDVRAPGSADRDLAPQLGDGERQAIALAHELGANLLLIDETRARNEAKRLGFKVAGTLGILREAHLLRLLNLREALAHLRATSFQADEALLESVLASVGLSTSR